jgi:hypothetical protein
LISSSASQQANWTPAISKNGSGWLFRPDRCSKKALFEAAEASFRLHSPDKVNTGNAERGPLLLTIGGQDHAVPKVITKSALRQQGL